MTVVHDGARLRISVFTGGPFQENCYLVHCVASGRAAVVDPGAATPELVQAATKAGLTPEVIWLTHAHLDHVDGIPALLGAFEVPIALHPDDHELYRRAPDQARAFGLPFLGELPDPSLEFEAGQEIVLGECRFDVRHAPGHAPGHVVLVEHDEAVALVGDVIFQRSIGRTDLPGGDTQALLASIRREILTLPDGVRLLPGHGPPTSVGDERMGNPFLRPMTGGPGRTLA
ncbi:MAG: MBL fold metallo-hydrolase [Gemmatimonadales bacterium]|nr:MAG: MBL fold metallo-hydrolase [Gemmatimonadales bacterium]